MPHILYSRNTNYLVGLWNSCFWTFREYRMCGICSNRNATHSVLAKHKIFGCFMKIIVYERFASTECVAFALIKMPHILYSPNTKNQLLCENSYFGTFREYRMCGICPNWNATHSVLAKHKLFSWFMKILVSERFASTECVAFVLIEMPHILYSRNTNYLVG